MDFGRAITFVFRDPAWPRKLLTGALLCVLPAAVSLLTAFLLADGPLGANALLSTLVGVVSGAASAPIYGFVLRIARSVAAGVDLPLPEWGDLGGIVRDGLKVWGVITVWGLPFTLLGLIGFDVDPEAGGGAAGASLALVCLGGLLGIALFVVVPAATARLATTGSFAAGLDVGAAFGTVRRNLGDYLLIFGITALGALLGLAVINGVVWLVWGGLGGDPTFARLTAVGGAVANILFLPYAFCVQYHLYGQAYFRANRGPVLPPGANLGAAT